MSKIYTLTTIDNPYNPFKNFDDWYNYDMQMGYNTLGYLARVCKTSDEFSDEDQDRDIDRAINDIVRINPNGLYSIIYSDQNPKELLERYAEVQNL